MSNPNSKAGLEEVTPGLNPTEQAQLDIETGRLKEAALRHAAARLQDEKRRERIAEYIAKVGNLKVEDRIERDMAWRKLKDEYKDVHPDELKAVQPPIPDVERLAQWVEEMPKETAAILLLIWSHLPEENRKLINSQYISGKSAASAALSVFVKTQLKVMGWKESVTLHEGSK
jgi:hypothetical protein